jgi:hypothetical protein
MKASALGLLALGLGLAVAGAVLEAAPPEASESAGADPALTSQETPTDDLLIRREKYFYSSFARRDPFASLISGKFSASGGGELLDIGELTLVGVVWGDADRFAVVQDQRDRVHVLREGDRVVNGKVIEVDEWSLTVQHYFFGETANVTIYLEQGEGFNETR